MKRAAAPVRCLACAAALAATGGRAPGEEPPDVPLALRLLAPYGAVTGAACEIRRVVDGPEGRLELLSRVFWERPDRLHVENYAPVRRRIVCDGTNFFSRVEGAPRGFSRPVARLDADMLAELRRVPGAPEDHLRRVAAWPESALPAGEGFAQRRGYAGPDAYAVVSADAAGRLARIDYYESAARKERRSGLACEDYREVLPGVWVPFVQRGDSTARGRVWRETTRVERYEANRPIAPGLFDPGAFFPSGEFVDDFGRIDP